MKVATTSKNPGVIRFAANLQRAADRLDMRLALFVEKLVLDLYTLIVMGTPVDTGRARASWNVAFDQPDEKVPPLIPSGDKSAREAARKAGKSVGIHPMFQQFEGIPPAPAAIKGIDAKRKIFITSNLAYINALEQGHSGQAPQGMVRIAVASMETAVEVATSTGKMWESDTL